MSRKVSHGELAYYLSDNFKIQFNGDWKKRAKFEVVYEWCIDQFGPMALEHVTNEEGRRVHLIDAGDGTWISTGREFWFRDPDHATIFKMVWC